MSVSTLNLAETTLAEVWPDFATRLEMAHTRLQQELESCWHDVQTTLDAQLQQLQSTALTAPPELAAFQTARAEAAQLLLSEPLAQWERRRPYQRALLVFENYDRSLAELTRALPEAVMVNGVQARDAVQTWQPTSFARRLTWVRRKGQRLALGQLVTEELPLLALRRAGIEGRFLLALAQAVQQIRKNWEVARVALDAPPIGSAAPAAKPAPEARLLSEELKRWASIQQTAQTALTELQAWPAQLQRQLANRLLRQTVWRRAFKAGTEAKRHDAYLTHWAEQGQTLATELRFEAALERSEDSLLTEAKEALASLQDEAQRIGVERDEFIAWLRARQAGDAQTLVPPPQAAVVPAVSRLAEFTNSLQQTLQSLPPAVLIQARWSATPRRQVKPRALQPRETFTDAFAHAGRAALTELFAGVETGHQQIVHEIERAREVVAFGLGETGGGLDPQIADEALQNALALLEFQRDEARDWRPSASQRAALTLAAVFNENRLVLSRNRLGALAHLGQQGLRRGGALALSALAANLRKGLQHALAGAKNLGETALIFIGWLPAPSAVAGHVVTRPMLPVEFTADLNAKELPAIYRRLFRVEAVQDPRFLIGRDNEMTALAEARTLWEAGRPVSALLVGERGSGKTSLINCALVRPLAGLEVTRGEFNQRLMTRDEMRGFLATLLGVPDPADLERALAAGRRVIILEELERTFLRQIGHYEPLRELQRLIMASCQTTFWIVVTNQIAFRFLDAATGLGECFSHQLNAASASREALREALLLRHKLSGLRLQFGAAPVAGGRIGNWLNRLRGQADPERDFFDKLARESAGVFRAAFEIWLGQIEAVRGGALYLNPLVTPDLTPVIDDLDQGDLFTLVAVMQHGSLTPEEFGIIFQKSLAASRAQMDELLAREICEPDPGRPGFRVRPEALRVVQEALYRRNLL